VGGCDRADTSTGIAPPMAVSVVAVVVQADGGSTNGGDNRVVSFVSTSDLSYN